MQPGIADSDVAFGVYYILRLRHPDLQPGGGYLHHLDAVTISTSTGGATIRYTTNGTTPSETVGTVYSSPIAITATCTLQAIAYVERHGQQCRYLRGLHDPMRSPTFNSGGRHL